MTEQDEKLRELALEYEHYKTQIEALQDSLSLIDTSILQIESTIEALSAASSLEEGREILLPVGSDSFLSAQLRDTEKAIVGIGAGYAVKKSIGDAIAELRERKGELERMREDRAKALEKVLTAAQEVAPRLQEELARLQKEG